MITIILSLQLELKPFWGCFSFIGILERYSDEFNLKNMAENREYCYAIQGQSTEPKYTLSRVKQEKEIINNCGQAKLQF